MDHIFRSCFILKRIGFLLLAILLLFTSLPVSATAFKEGGGNVILHADSPWFILDGEWVMGAHAVEKDAYGNFFISLQDFRAFFKCQLSYNPSDSSVFLQHEGRELWQGLNTPVLFVDTLPYPNPAAYLSAASGEVMIPAEPYASVLGYHGVFSISPDYAPGQLSLTLPPREYKLSHIEMNKEMQMVIVYGKDHLGTVKALKHFLCSTGNPSSLTPNGTFYARPLTYSATGNPWYYFGLHNCWVLYCTQLTGNICFHSLTFNQYAASSLSKTAYQALGHPASHGCIRLMIEDARFIWENCGGVPVTITNGFYDETLQSIKEQLLRARPDYSAYVEELVKNY